MIDMNDKNSVSVILIQEIMIDMNDKNSASRPRPQPGPARHGERGTPCSFYQLHKWSAVGPPFKSVKILIDFQCGIESLALICGPFNS
jgi:hypothetical protein